MLSRILHGLAVLLALLAIVLLDRAFAQSLPNPGAEEIATFAARFSALTDAPQPPPAAPQGRQIASRGSIRRRFRRRRRRSLAPPRR